MDSGRSLQQPGKPLSWQSLLFRHIQRGTTKERYRPTPSPGYTRSILPHLWDAYRATNNPANTTKDIQRAERVLQADPQNFWKLSTYWDFGYVFSYTDAVSILGAPGSEPMVMERTRERRWPAARRVCAKQRTGLLPQNFPVKPLCSVTALLKPFCIKVA